MLKKNHMGKNFLKTRISFLIVAAAELKPNVCSGWSGAGEEWDMFLLETAGKL